MPKSVFDHLASNPPALSELTPDKYYEQYLAIWRRYGALAMLLRCDLPEGAEKTTAGRKLLESRDSALRALEDKESE